MLEKKKEMIQQREVEFSKKQLFEIKKKFVEDKLEEKEHLLYEKMQRDTTSVPQMFHDYLNFKYDIYKWRLESQVKTQLFAQIAPATTEDESVTDTLKYDLGTPIFLNTLASKIHSKLVDKASVLAYYQDPRDTLGPSEYE